MMSNTLESGAASFSIKPKYSEYFSSVAMVYSQNILSPETSDCLAIGRISVIYAGFT